MLGAATAAMALATSAPTSLASLIAAFFVFEVCVGLYFPSIGTLRSKYIPDANRGVVLNLFAIPLNLIVISVFTMQGSLGLAGTLRCSTVALAGGCAASLALRRVTAAEQE